MDKQVEQGLWEDIGGFYDDPLGYVRYMFPWGEGRLAGASPEDWQVERLRTVGRLVSEKAPMVRMQTVAGKGVGKTAFVAWLVHWFVVTRAHCQARVTAGTWDQLQTTTWRELAKWHELSLVKPFFEVTATSFHHVKHPKTWGANAFGWKEDRPEAFAGMHDRDALVVKDEASQIPDVIWEYAEGALTDPGAMFLTFGNPTRNTGRFAKNIQQHAHRWNVMHVDARTCRRANRALHEEWIADYGLDSDWVRVNILGQLPRLGTQQFIARDVVDTAVRYEAGYFVPKVFGIDVATGYGTGKSVIAVREGRRLTALHKYHCDTMEFAAAVAGLVAKEKPDAVFVDGIGVGVGLVDRLRQLGVSCVPVNAGLAAQDSDRYRNKRSEMWGEMKAWLREGAELLDDKELAEQLCQVEFSQTEKQQIALERKKDMINRGLESPDCADALALTFAYPVVPAATEDEEFAYHGGGMLGATAWMM